MKDQIFGVLQRVGRSFMLPIAVLPVAGLLLGIGSSFTNATMIDTYGLQAILGEGTILNMFLTVLSKAGSALFDNLPIIFAVGCAIGMAKKEKEVAALSAVIAYFTMNAAVNAMLVNSGQILDDGSIADFVLQGTITSSVGIKTLQMGVFGGIIVGLGVAALHNRFYTIELPSALAFFSGSRFVPIISTVVYVLVGIGMFFVWPMVQNGIYALGGLVTGTGYLGTLIFGIIKRALIPFGLHHVFYLPFWQTGVGGSMEVAGKMIEGGQNIFFAQLADPSTVHFSADACRYFSGEFIFMIFGLPGAALAKYQTAKPEKKKTGRWTSALRSTGMYGNWYYRAAGVFFPVCSTYAVCSTGDPGRCSVYDRSYSEHCCWTDIFRRTSGSVPVWYPSGKCKDQLASDHSGGNHLFPVVLRYLQIPDPQI